MASALVADVGTGFGFMKGLDDLVLNRLFRVSPPVVDGCRTARIRDAGATGAELTFHGFQCLNDNIHVCSDVGPQALLRVLLGPVMC